MGRVLTKEKLSYGTEYEAIGAGDVIRTRDTLLGRNNLILNRF